MTCKFLTTFYLWLFLNTSLDVNVFLLFFSRGYKWQWIRCRIWRFQDGWRFGFSWHRLFVYLMAYSSSSVHTLFPTGLWDLSSGRVSWFYFPCTRTSCIYCYHKGLLDDQIIYVDMNISLCQSSLSLSLHDMLRSRFETATSRTQKHKSGHLPDCVTKSVTSVILYDINILD